MNVIKYMISTEKVASGKTNSKELRYTQNLEKCEIFSVPYAPFKNTKIHCLRHRLKKFVLKIKN